jgi:hypothetical protein
MILCRVAHSFLFYYSKYNKVSDFLATLVLSFHEMDLSGLKQSG